jgi:GntR family transcriptional regulator
MAAKYDRIAADLRRKIQTGHLIAGARIPAETALKDEYGVSLLTMRRALDVLEMEGLIEKRHGLGNFVRTPRRRVRRTTARYQWEKDRALMPEEERRVTGATEYDTGLTFTDLHFEATYAEVQADVELAEAFSLPVGTPLLRRSYRTRSRDEEASLTLATSYLVHERIASNPDLLSADNEPWPGGTSHQLYTVGIEVDHIVDEVTARPPSADEAEALGIAPGVSLLVLRKTSVDTTGRVIEVADVLMAGDRTQLVYTTNLTRYPA